MEYESDGDGSCNCYARYRHQKNGIGRGGIEN